MLPSHQTLYLPLISYLARFLISFSSWDVVRLVSVTINPKSNVWIGNISTVYAGPTTIMLVTLDLLELLQFSYCVGYRAIWSSDNHSCTTAPSLYADCKSLILAKRPPYALQIALRPHTYTYCRDVIHFFREYIWNGNFAGRSGTSPPSARLPSKPPGSTSMLTVGVSENKPCMPALTLKSKKYTRKFIITTAMNNPPTRMYRMLPRATRRNSTAGRLQNAKKYTNTNTAMTISNSARREAVVCIWYACNRSEIHSHLLHLHSIFCGRTRDMRT